jgi:hypothetical protein
VTAGWTLSLAVGLAVVYGLSPYVDQSKVPEISFAIKITYGPLHRTAWACVIAWIIFACSRGYGGRPIILSCQQCVNSSDRF